VPYLQLVDNTKAGVGGDLEDIDCSSLEGPWLVKVLGTALRLVTIYADADVCRGTCPHDEPLVSKTVVTLNYFESFKGIFLNYKKEAFIRAYSFSVFRNNANIKALAGNSGLVTISTYRCLSLPKF